MLNGIWRLALAATTTLVSVPVMAQGNADRFSISPSVSATYDTNIARRNPDFFEGPTENMRYSPRVRVAANRQFGRTAVALSGSLGYDFNSPRFSYLDREAIMARLTAKLPVGSQCPIDLAAEHQQSQFDFNDTDTVSSSLQTIRRFDADLSCSRPGLSPNFGATYRTMSNGANPSTNSTYQEARGGVKMTVPSIGALALNGQLAKITTPNMARADTNLMRVYLTLERAVAPRLTFFGAFGYTATRRQASNASTFSGFSFKLNAGYDINSQLRLTIEGLRDVENSPGLFTPFMVRRYLQGGLDVNVIHKVGIQIRAGNTHRRFELTADSPLLLASDTVNTLSVRANREIGRKFNLGIGGRLMKRNANLERFTYDSAAISASLGARF